MVQVLKIIRHVKDCITEDSLENLLWLLNIVPSLAGFTLLKEKVSPVFWLIHVPLLLYVYGIGSFMYQAYDAEGRGDYLRSDVSVALLIFTAHMNYWFWKERPVIMSLVNKVREADELAKTTEIIQEKHKKSLRTIKIIIIIFYFCNCVNGSLVYWPHRMDITSHYGLRPCVGMESLTSTPNLQICRAIILIAEITLSIVVLYFQTLVVFFIAHTAVMYQMMTYEMISLDNKEIYSEEHNNLVKQKLPTLIYRHVLIIDIVGNLKKLYSVSIGINFVSDAMCMCLFFFLPLQSWLSFMPVVVYCFLVFFLYCFLGQRLINSSEVFERAVYACGWESFEVKEKKAVYVMLCLAQKPVEILAADIIPVNISTFATTLQAMYKFVTVMKF